MENTSSSNFFRNKTSNIHKADEHKLRSPENPIIRVSNTMLERTVIKINNEDEEILTWR